MAERLDSNSDMVLFAYYHFIQQTETQTPVGLYFHFITPNTAHISIGP